MKNWRIRLFLGGLLLLGALITLDAADLNKALSGADGRLRAARTGAISIKAKAAQQVEQARAAYVVAAIAHNAWLDATCDAITKGSAELDVSALTATAGSTFVQWVAARNQALGEPIIAGAIAATVENQVTRELTDITAELTRSNRGRAENRRSRAATDLATRLRWKAWDELQ